MDDIAVQIARLDERLKALSILLDERQKQVGIAFDASQKASETALAAQKQVNATQNEFRGTLIDQARTFMPRSEAEQANKAMNEKLDILTNRVNDRESRGVGISQSWGLLIGAAGLVAAVIAIGYAVFGSS